MALWDEIQLDRQVAASEALARRMAGMIRGATLDEWTAPDRYRTGRTVHYHGGEIEVDVSYPYEPDEPEPTTFTVTVSVGGDSHCREFPRGDVRHAANFARKFVDNPEYRAEKVTAERLECCTEYVRRCLAEEAKAFRLETPTDFLVFADWVEENVHGREFPAGHYATQIRITIRGDVKTEDQCVCCDCDRRIDQEDACDGPVGMSVLCEACYEKQKKEQDLEKLMVQASKGDHE